MDISLNLKGQFMRFLNQWKEDLMNYNIVANSEGQFRGLMGHIWVTIELTCILRLTQHILVFGLYLIKYWFKYCIILDAMESIHVRLQLWFLG